MHACSRSSSGVAKNGFEPHFEAILDFFGLGKRRMFPRTQHWPLSKTPFVLSRLLCGVSPSRHTHRREKTSDRKQLDSGGWGCRMTRLFSHENGLYTLRSLKPAKFPLRGPRRGCFAPPRRPEAHPDRHYHPRHFRKRSRCPGSHPRNGRAPAGVTPTNRALLASAPGGRWGSVVCG